jgi:serralysin
MSTAVRDFTALIGTSWNHIFDDPIPQGKPLILTFAFPSTPPPSMSSHFGPGAAATFEAFNEAEKQLARAALTKWAEVSGIQFVEVSDAARADIRFSFFDFNHGPLPSAGGLGYFPSSPFYRDSVGGIYPQSDEYWISQGNHYSDLGGDTFYNSNIRHTGWSPEGFTFTLLHEIGHAIGLKHPHDQGGEYDAVLATDLDHASNTVMSYVWNAPATNLGPFDIAAAQFLYGGPNSDGSQFQSVSYDPVSETFTLTAFDGADQIRGTGTHDIIHARGGDDAVYAASGNDVVYGGAGLDKVSGGVGIDLYVVGGLRSNATLDLSAHATYGDVWIELSNGWEYATDFERIGFSDQIVALDIQGNAGDVYRLYQAAFDRTPDRPGLSSNISLMDDGLTLKQMSAAFVASQEFIDLYGANTTNSQFVTLLYQNVLGRGPDQAGLDGWVNVLNTGQADRAEVLIGFSESPENHGYVDPTIRNGITLDLNYFV